jgi:DNA-binding CsgD family transcriptional regulator
VLHARIVSSIGRSDWAALLRAVDDDADPGHRRVFDDQEWIALRALAVWHLDRLVEYRGLYAEWTRMPGADDSAYRWAHDAILARIDRRFDDVLTATARSLEALTDADDPLGRTWVRIVAGTHLSHHGDPVEGLACYEEARVELVELGADAFAALCTAIIRRTSDELARASGDDPAAALSGRQREIAELVAAGYTSSEIGQLLHLSKKTIDFHVGNIVVRLGVSNRREIRRALGGGRGVAGS